MRVGCYLDSCEFVEKKPHSDFLAKSNILQSLLHAVAMFTPCCIHAYAMWRLLSCAKIATSSANRLHVGLPEPHHRSSMKKRNSRGDGTEPCFRMVFLDFAPSKSFLLWRLASQACIHLITCNNTPFRSIFSRRTSLETQSYALE